MQHSDIIWQNYNVSKEERSSIKKQKPCILWFTGLSGSGKSTIADGLEKRLYDLGKHTFLLDGDNVRHGLNNDLGFNDQDRVENIRRVGEVGKLFVDAGLIVLSAFISPFDSDRNIVRKLVKDWEFIEIFVDAPLEICEQRDPKGLYSKARRGEIPFFTGISSPYEIPQNPDIHIHTDKMKIEESIDVVIEYLYVKKYLS